MSIEEILNVSKKIRNDGVDKIKENDKVYLIIPKTKYVGRTAILIIKETKEVRLMRSTLDDQRLAQNSKVIWENEQ